jgi:hypothetical protein
MESVRLPPKQQRHRFCDCEDRLLENLVQQHGTSSWDQVAAGLPGRTARQCRERWKHHLSGRESAWTEAEDDFLWQKVGEIGQKWTRIASLLSDRTDYQAKTRWTYLFKQRRRSCFRSAQADFAAKGRRKHAADQSPAVDKPPKVHFAGIEELLAERLPQAASTGQSARTFIEGFMTWSAFPVVRE